MFFHNRWNWWLNMMREALQPWFSVFATHQSLQGGRSAGAAVDRCFSSLPDLHCLCPAWANTYVEDLGSQPPPLKAGTDQGDSQDHPEQNGGTCAPQNN